ncbi:hypothetical protein BDF22DRAFT_775326 [Syncephalis plumigaleata]|nr:hypothetical protein BDF22DRAFT_775326 [Syncephalis plumigaleata]
MLGNTKILVVVPCILARHRSKIPHLVFLSTNCTGDLRKMKRLSCTLIAAAMLLVSASAIPILDKSNGSLNGNQASLTRNARRATRMQSALASDDVVTSDSDDSDQTTRNKSKWMDEIEDAERELRESINLIINSNSDNDSGKDTEDRQAVKSDTLMDENSGSNTEHEPTNPSTRQLFEMANAGQEELPQHSTANSALVVKDGKRPVSRIIQHVEKGIRLMGPYRRSRNDKKRHGSQDSTVTDATITANHVVKPSSPSDNAAFGPFIEQQMTTMSSDTSTSSNNVVKDETSNVSPLLNDDDDQNADELPDNDRQPIAASTNSLPTDVSIEPSAKPNNQLVSAKDKSNKKDSNNNSSNNNKAAPLVWTVVKHTAESASTDNEQSLSLANDRITEEPRMATDVKPSPQTTVDPSLSTPPTATLSTNAADINLSKLNTNNSNNNNNKNVATPSPPATAPTAPLNTGFIVSGQPQMGMMPSNGPCQ